MVKQATKAGEYSFITEEKFILIGIAACEKDLIAHIWRMSFTVHR